MRIFIVEDEYWALEELKQLLKAYRKTHDIHFYENGKAAYSDVIVLKPDLIVTDITMPELNGLELVEKVKEFDRTIECILLTVHDTFDYAKKGIQLGVRDYLLKPIKKESLYQILDEAIKRQIERSAIRKNEEIMILSQMFINQEETSHAINHVMEEQQLYLLYVLFERSEYPISLETFLKDTDLEVLWTLPLNDQNYLIIIPYGLSVTEKILKLYNHLINQVQVHFCFEIKRHNDGLLDTYNKVKTRLEKYKLFGMSSYIEPNFSQDKEKDFTVVWESVRIIEKRINEGTLGLIRMEIDQLVDTIKKMRLTEIELQRVLLDVHYALTYNLHLDVDNSKLNNDRSTIRLNRISSFTELRQGIFDIIDNFTSIMNNDDIQPKHLIPSVQKWIETSYYEQITFKEFADQHHVSLSYLSREFKDQTGNTFSDYLTKVRIDKSCQLLDKNTHSTKEVGELVGYRDPKHFRDVFKKVTGLSIREYKNQYTQ